MNACVGIISYIPDGNLKDIRKTKLASLIKQCDALFGLPIIIVAQNWLDISLPETVNSKIMIFSFANKLGITGARRELRKRFLESEYDYLIMLDDDSVLVGTKEYAENYITLLNTHPCGFGIRKTNLLKLLAISKEVYNLVDFPLGEPENGDYFEDMWLTNWLKKKVPDKEFMFHDRCINEESNSNDSVTSTWYKGQINKHAMGNATRKMIAEL